MPVERRPEHQPHLEPPTELALEMPFGTVMRRAVEDLFTYQPIAERLAGLEEDEALQTFVEQWKHRLAANLTETGELAVPVSNYGRNGSSAILMKKAGHSQET